MSVFAVAITYLKDAAADGVQVRTSAAMTVADTRDEAIAYIVESMPRLEGEVGPYVSVNEIIEPWRSYYTAEWRRQSEETARDKISTYIKFLVEPPQE